tara:strand:+ start:158 stop:385 length:228 start_codon:yes stop_codon:yes gene_type:complete
MRGRIVIALSLFLTKDDSNNPKNVEAKEINIIHKNIIKGLFISNVLLLKYMVMIDKKIIDCKIENNVKTVIFEYR